MIKMSYNVKLDSDTAMNLSLYLFKDIKNAAVLKDMVIGGKLDCCIIKPNLIVHPFQVVVAANKAVVSQMQNRMTTRTLSTEILFNLSSSKNITQSLVKFGVADNDKNMLVCIIEGEGENKTDEVLCHFEGELTPVDELHNFSDETLIRKTYKIKDTTLSALSLLDLIVTSIVTRELT